MSMCNVAYARARVGKSRYTKGILAAQAIRSTSLHRKPRRREDQKSHSTHSTDHIQREKAPMAMFHSYIIMYINVSPLGPSQFPHLRFNQITFITSSVYSQFSLHCTAQSCAVPKPTHYSSPSLFSALPSMR